MHCWQLSQTVESRPVVRNTGLTFMKPFSSNQGHCIVGTEFFGLLKWGFCGFSRKHPVGESRPFGEKPLFMIPTNISKMPNNPVDAIPRLQLTEKRMFGIWPQHASWFALSEQNRGLGEADKCESTLESTHQKLTQVQENPKCQDWVHN